ncbi:MAG: molybdopterin molybdotransferase MoeA [Methylococcaceae bacterium]|nr:molybdopterin molybdotransferase MoeA [Methylococcaceae bacterium]
MQAPDPCAASPADTLSLADALERMLAAVQPVAERERLPLSQSLGRVLAEPLTNPMPLPPFANSAMDGYALNGRDLAIAAETGLAIAGRALAGHPYRGELGDRECIRIFTGAPMPPGADTVIMQEQAHAGEDGRVRFSPPLRPGANVRPAGDDLPAGAALLEAGRRLGAVDLALLASAGIATVTVNRPLRIAHFSTGDELTPLGTALEFGRIYDSNRYLLQGLLASPLLETRDMGLVADDRAALSQTLTEAAAWADLVISTAGVSVGDADLVTGVLAELGQVEFWKIAVKPGKPFAFGRIGTAWFCGLPGNPAAVLVAFQQLVRPALLRLAGAKPNPPLRLRAVSRNPLRKSPGRMEFQRGHCHIDANGTLTVTSCGAQGSHRLSGASQANCLIVLEGNSAGVSAGETVTIELLGGWHVGEPGP